MSTSLILRGILATIVGILALAWPGVTILALIILFAARSDLTGQLNLQVITSGHDRCRPG
jgi:uncharacterized membrane protein HdeD (DUF308 family)